MNVAGKQLPPDLPQDGRQRLQSLRQGWGLASIQPWHVGGRWRSGLSSMGGYACACQQVPRPVCSLRRKLMRCRMRHKFGLHFWAGRFLINEFGQTRFPISYTAALISQHICIVRLWKGCQSLTTHDSRARVALHSFCMFRTKATSALDHVFQSCNDRNQKISPPFLRV